jgi:hypothetical protein
MERLAIKLLIFRQVGDDIQMCVTPDRSGQQIVILTTTGGGKVRERLAVSKQTTHRFRTDRFNLKKLNGVEGKELYRVEISNRFAAMEN